MRILYIVPGPMGRTPAGAAEVARRGRLLREHAFPGTEVDIDDVAQGPASIESAYEEYLSVPAAVERAVAAEAAGYDAVILGCFGDPGLDAMREMVDIPVVGPGEASCLAAASLGYRFSILTIMKSTIGPTRHQVARIGLMDKLASIRSVETPVLELMADHDATVARFAAEGRRALEEDGADTLVLGCMTSGFMMTAEGLSRELGAPVVNPAVVSLKYAEMLVGSGLRHSRRGYVVPPKLSSGKVKDKSALMVR
jgi:allantoin racemase